MRWITTTPTGEARSVSRRKLAAGVLAAFFGLFGAIAVHAQNDPSAPEGEKGFSADKAYHLGGSDNVNLFNGNLVITIPLGQSFPVNHFSYGFHLTYNSTVWTREGLPTPKDSVQRSHTIPNTYSNAGVGWYFDAGPMWPDCVQHCTEFEEFQSSFFRTPDGATHSFWDQLHTDETATAGVAYTRDSTYMRTKTESGVQWLDSSDGTRVRHGSGTVGGYSYGRPAEERDWFGNSVTYDYTDPTQVRVTDSLGRVQIIRFKTFAVTPAHDTYNPAPTAVDAYPANYQYLPWQVELTAFNGKKLLYTFTYELHDVPRNQLWSSGVPEQNEPTWDSLPFLVRLDASDTTGHVLQTWTFDYNYTNSNEHGESATLRSMKVPTGGTYDYEYKKVIMPGSYCSDAGGGSPLVRVARRTVNDQNQASGEWTYTQRFREQTQKITLVCGSSNHPDDFPEPEEITVQVTPPPPAAVSVNYFSQWKDTFDSYYGTRKSDDGLPYTRRIAIGGKFLSSEEFDCTKETCQADCTIAGNCPLARSTYVRYERDFDTLLHSANSRLAETMTVFHDDPSGCTPGTTSSSCRYINTLSSDFDGLGHYRQTDVTSNFPGAHAKKSFTHFIATTSTYGKDAQGNRLPYSPFEPNRNWLLNVYDDQWSEENGTATRAYYKFDPSTGLITSMRVPKVTGATHDAIVPSDTNTDDLLVTYCYTEADHVSSHGNLLSEKHFGGDGVPFNANALPCATAIDSSRGEYQIDYEYSNGVRSTAKYLGSGLFNLNRQIDSSTGLPIWAKDPSDFQTDFDFDVLGRMTWRRPAAGAATEISYRGPGETEYPKPTLLINERPHGDDNGTPLAQSKHEFDGLGRPWREWRKAIDGTWKVKQTLADIHNWTTSVSEFDDTPQHFTTFDDFDGFGRAHVVRQPDNSKTDIAYTGTSFVSRSVNVRTGGDAQTFTMTTALTKETYDDGGRLVKIEEPNRTVTNYDYDVAGRLTKVCMNVSGSTCGQTRLFTYDNRGFLTSETHPEKGIEGNGTTSYDEYDAFGHAHHKLDGPAGGSYDVQFDFDTIGRLTQMQTRGATPRVIKQFNFNCDNAGASLAKGKLCSAVRFNWFDLNGSTYNIQISENYTYAGIGGRPDSRRTDEFDCTVSATQNCKTLLTGTPTRSFSTGFTYTELGRTSTVDYPTCSVGCSNVVAPRTITNNYTNGYLASVRFPYNGVQKTEAISYLPNGMVGSVVHSNGVVDTQTSYFGTTRIGSISATATDASSCTARITLQPASTTVAPGGTAVLNIAVSGTGPFKYEWFEGFRGDTRVPLTPTSGTSTFTTPSLTAATMYWVRVTDDGAHCSVDSATALVAICTPATIVTGLPSVQTVHTGDSLNFTVNASGDAPLSYAWTRRLKTQSEAQAVSVGTNSPTLAENAPSTTGVYVYTVSVTSAATGSGCATPATSSVEVTVIAPAQCASPLMGFDAFGDLPAALTFPEGGQYDLAVHVVNAHGTVHYQWYDRRGALGATGSSITITNRTGEYNIYRVHVYDDCNSVDSTSTHVKTIGTCPLPPLTLNQQTIDLSGSDSFIATMDWPGITYHWYKGQTADTRNEISYGIDPSTPNKYKPTLAGTYWVRATASCGTNVDSPTLIVTNATCSPVVFVAQPAGITSSLAGSPHELSAEVTADPAPWSYAWYDVGGSGYPLSLTDKVTVSPVKTTSYYVQIQNSCSDAKSQLATIHVTSCSDINIAAQPQDAFINGGDPAPMIFVTASAASGLTYQWYQGESGDTSNPVTGQTTSTLTIAPAVTTKYWVRLSQPLIGSCAVDSRTATINVCRTPVMQKTIYDSVRNGYTYPNVTVPAAGWRVYLAAEATGDNLTYQWFEGSDNTNESAPAGTGATISVVPFVTTMYWVKVTSACTGKPNATVKILPFYASLPPSIETQPAVSTIVMPNTTATLSVAASGTYLKYEWRAGQPGGSGPILGTSATFTTPPITATSTFFCRVYSGNRSIDSEAATVDLCSGPAVWWTQITTEVKYGQGQTITVGYAPIENTTLDYYEGQSGDVAHSTLLSGGSMNAALSLPAATVTKSYWVRAKNGTCYADTPTSTVSVCIPTITTQPASVISTGNVIDLTVAANTGGLTYQWYEGNAGDRTKPLAAPAGQLATYHFTPTYTANYWVRVTGTCAKYADSNVVTATLCAAPQITTQPAPRVVTRGASTNVAVTTNGTNLTYQWYQGNSGVTTSPVNGATTASLTTPALYYTTSYWVKVSGYCGTINSNTVTVSVTPTITAQPADVSVTKGTGATLSVTADANPVSYQWYRGAAGDVSNPICTNSATCTTPAVFSDTQFWVRVTSGIATADSTAATAHVCQGPTVTVTQPANQLSNANVTLTIASPDTTHTFAWYNGLSGDTSSLITSGAGYYVITVHPTQTSNYWVREISSVCSADSATINVPICTPSITAQPANTSVNQGQQVTLNVAATGTPTLTYQWYNGTSGNTSSPVSGATGPSLTFTASSTASYWVRVINGANGAACYANSTTATVTVCIPPSITTHPSNPIITRNQSATIGVTAGGSNLQYQWYQGAKGVTTTPVGGNSNLLSITPLTTTSYWVRVSACSSSVDSNAGLVSVYPIINTQPANVRITKNTSATFSVSADASPVLYQWYAGVSPDTTNLINGATNASYTTPALAADANYWVKVTSGNAVTYSSTATATICTSSTVNVSTTQVSGSNATLSIATPNAGETYSWYQGTSGVTTTPLALNTPATQITVTPTQTTSYWVRTFSGSCSSDSATVQVPICYPKVNTPTGTLGITSGQQTTLTVSATGTPTLTYQWYTGKSGNTSQPVANGTGASVTVQPGSNTSYWVRVTSSTAGGCYADSPAVTVTVCQLPVITTQPQAQNYPTSSYSRYISVVASGTNLTYQWYEGATGVTTTPVGAHTAQIAITPGVSKYYWVRVSNACGNTDSVAALQSVAPTINSYTPDTTICAGTSTTLSVSASGTMMSYQWYKTTAGTTGDTTQPVGTNSPNYTTPALTQNGYYWAKVTSGTAYSITPTITITADPGPAIGVNMSYLYTNCWMLTVSVPGYTGDYYYSWYRGLPGDTSQLISQSYYAQACGGGSKVWVRVTDSVTGCKTDSTAVTLP